MKLRLKRRDEQGDVDVVDSGDTQAHATYSVVSALEQLRLLRAEVRILPSPRVITFVAGKGGAGKTSTSANFAAMTAAAGYRVLVIDLDVQANQTVLFGIPSDDPGVDQGQGFLSAVVAGQPELAKPLRDVRPGLDLMTGGTHTRKLSDYLTLSERPQRRELIRGVVEQLARDYDLVLVDSRPVGELLGEVAVLAADYLVIPTRTDAMSWDRGFKIIADLYETAEATARVLGAVIFATGRTSTQIQAKTRSQLQARLGDIAPVFQTMIYHSERAAKDQSERGLLADEYAMAAKALAKPFWEDPNAPRFASNSSGPAEDYANLSVEIVEEMLR